MVLESAQFAREGGCRVGSACDADPSWRGSGSSPGDHAPVVELGSKRHIGVPIDQLCGDASSMEAMRFDALTKSLATFPARKRGETESAASAPGRSRRAGQACPAGRVACDGTCLNPWVFRHDARNCGACGVACPHGGVCCDGMCLDLTIDASNCGACGHACPGSVDCLAGECV